MSNAGTLLPVLTLAVTAAWRLLDVWSVAHRASRRWRLRTALPWAAFLVGIDLVALLAAALTLLPRFPSVPAIGGPEVLRGIAAPTLALLASGATRRFPWGRNHQIPLQKYLARQIEQACYDQADRWIYSTVYPVVAGPRVKPFLNELRGYLESQPGAKGRLDASYLSSLIHTDGPPDREALRAACHRMLARSGHRRLVSLVAQYEAGASGPVGTGRNSGLISGTSDH